ncbi:hypothetical protein EVG20_g8785 [Dentipellis fragilis]|uniref:Uncharacterized protein n=1 Tax=Dentipellis fragilis TaxID=205917 RepID=A0A4Y9Y5U4_9AGAM|nr:hypothetical protein EVG20_g8785 [Dentipellis fragilis]
MEASAKVSAHHLRALFGRLASTMEGWCLGAAVKKSWTHVFRTLLPILSSNVFRYDDMQSTTNFGSLSARDSTSPGRREEADLIMSTSDPHSL